jgi:hypothetical protein
MSDIAGRVADRAHLGPGGAGWQANGSAFSNATGRLNLITNPVAGYRVSEDAGSLRSLVTVLPNGLIFLQSVGAINPFVPATTVFFNVPSGLNLQVKSFFVRCTAAVGVSAPCRAGVGINGGVEIYQDQSLVGLTASGLTYRFPTGGSSAIVPQSQQFTFTVSVQPTGTSQTLQVEAYGRLFA